MPERAGPHDGPDLQDYVETRLNLLTVAADKAERGLRERIDAVESAGVARAVAFAAAHDLTTKSTNDRFLYVERLTAQAEDNTKLATATAADVQKQHNVAQNEWRATLTDFRQNTPTRPEFDKITSEVTALRLELSTRLSLQQGERAGTKETTQEHRSTKEDSRAGMAIVIAAATGVVASILSLVAIVVSLRAEPTRPLAAAATPPQVVYSIPLQPGQTPPQPAPR